MTLVYFLVLLLYLLASFINNLSISLILKTLIGFFSLFFFRKYYKFKIRFDFFAVLVGILIAFIWVFGNNFYALLNIDIKNNVFNLYDYGFLDVILKAITFVIFTPVIEEFFMRFWLIRFIISKNWEEVEIGKFTLLSFLFTTLFFGFSHILWIQGIISGILFNVVYYLRKYIESCILAHFVSNLFLFIYVLYSGNSVFW